MVDQATRLRELADLYRTRAIAPSRRTKAIAITSGKGGVGKSNIGLSLAHALMNEGRSVLLLDADLGLANADILLGTVPPYHLGHLLGGERSIRELIHHTPTGLKLIAGGSGVTDLANLPGDRLKLFLSALAQLEGEADYLILDTGAGLSGTVMEFVLASDQVLVVTTPEPTSLADGYATIKALANRSPGVVIKLVVNQVESKAEADAVAERIISTARTFLGLSVEHLGEVPRDPYVWRAVREQTPFIYRYPQAPASRAVQAMGRRLNRGQAEILGPTRSQGFFDRLTALFGRRP